MGSPKALFGYMIACMSNVFQSLYINYPLYPLCTVDSSFILLLLRLVVLKNSFPCVIIVNINNDNVAKECVDFLQSQPLCLWAVEPQKHCGTRIGYNENDV